MHDPHHNDLLRGLTGSELALALPHLERREFKAGQIILHWGEPGDCLYVIESGLVCVALRSRGGAESLLAQLGPGQIFGEMSILTGQPRSAEVRALVDTTTYALSVSSFFKVAGRSPTMLLNIGRVLAGRLGHMTRANTYRERRALVVLVGPVPALVGSLLATNLVAALSFVSGRTAMLVDVPEPRAAKLPGREWAPNLDELRGNEDTIAHLTRLTFGPIAIHAVNLPELDGLPVEGGIEALTRTLSRLARVAELVVVNLAGASDGLVEAVVPMANRVYVVAPSGLLGGNELGPLIEGYRERLGANATLGVIGLTGDGAPTSAVRESVRRVPGVSGCVVLPGQAEMIRGAASVEPPMVLHAPRLATSKALTALARDVAGLRVGLALGSGAAKGVAHVGLIAALDRLGVPIDAVTGTSIGALVGAGLAMGMDMDQIGETMDRLVDLWREALRLTLPRIALFRPEGLERVVHELAGDVRFEELTIPFGAVATDLNTGRAVHIRSGSVGTAVRASIGIPLIFPPVVVGDYTLVDGFLTNPVPTLFARELGADVVLASNLSNPVEEEDQSPLEFAEPPADPSLRKPGAPNILDTYMRCQDIIMAGRGEHDCLAADLTFRPRLAQMSWKDFQKGGVPLEAGERAVEAELAALRELLPWMRVAG